MNALRQRVTDAVTAPPEEEEGEEEAADAGEGAGAGGIGTFGVDFGDAPVGARTRGSSRGRRGTRGRGLRRWRHIVDELWRGYVFVWDTAARLLGWVWGLIDGVADRLGGWRTLALLLFAFIVAVATALATKYAGTAFGTSLWDYGNLFLWGLATKLVFETVLNGLDAIGVPRLLRR